MQGLWGVHRCLKAATDVAPQENLARLLPQGAFQLTHQWARTYDANELVQAIYDIGIDFLLSRSSLVSLVAICEAALNRFNTRLADLGRCKKKTKNKQLLRWAFELVRDSQSGSPETIARLPQSCGDLDNARRLRNCIVHNNGKYDKQMYLDDAIHDSWIMVQHENDAARSVDEREPIFLVTDRFEYFFRSHIEFLHIMHNTVQSKYFGHGEAYNYGDEGKRIEWYRILSGRKVADM